MKLMRIQIESFAKWQNQTWELSNATMLFGLNEAGKTTILLFIESILFGFRTPITDRACGSLLFSDNENRWYIERRQGRTKAGELVVTCNGERMAPKDFLSHIDLATFRHLYRIDLEQLQKMEDANPEEMNRLLFDTSLTGVLALFERQKELRKSSLALFKPKGRKTEINVLSKELDQTKKYLKDWDDKLDQYGMLREELKKTESAIIDTEKEETDLQESRQLLEVKQLLSPLAGKWKETRPALEKEEKLPEHAIKSFEALNSSIHQLKEELSIIKAKLKQPEKERYSDKELSRLSNLIESFSKAGMFEHQLGEAEKEMDNLQLEMDTLKESVPGDVDLKEIRYSPPLLKRIEDLTDQQRSLKLEEKQQEKEQREKSVPDQSNNLMKYLPLGFFAAGGAALIFGEWVSAILFTLLGGGILLYYLFFSSKKKSSNPEMESTLESVKKDWEKFHHELDEWCDDAGFTYGLDLHTYRYTLEAAKKWQDLNQRKNHLQKQYQEAASWISRHNQEASLWTGDNERSSSEQLQDLKLIYAQAMEALSIRKQQEQKQEEYKERINELNANLEQLNNELQVWVQAAGAEDEREFWKVAQSDEELRKEKRTAMETWHQICAVAPNEAMRESLLDEIYTDNIVENSEALQIKTADLKKKKEELYERRTELSIELKRMEQGGTYAELQQKYEQQKIELASLVNRWAVYETAAMLVDDVRDVYEKEKQPNVLKDAESRFAKMTEGRYSHVHVPVGEKKFLVEREDGKTFAPADLSRGTRELLYISLRLALIREHPSLPICLDEALVNMDQPRRNALWKELRSVAGEHQVLFFTCHEHILKEWEQELQGIVYKL